MRITHSWGEQACHAHSPQEQQHCSLNTSSTMKDIQILTRRLSRPSSPLLQGICKGNMARQPTVLESLHQTCTKDGAWLTFAVPSMPPGLTVIRSKRMKKEVGASSYHRHPQTYVSHFLGLTQPAPLPQVQILSTTWIWPSKIHQAHGRTYRTTSIICGD